VREFSDFECRAAKAAADFYDAQKAFCVEHRKETERKHAEEASNPVVVNLRERLFAIYQMDALPQDIRVRAYALWSATESYIWKRVTGWPMVETNLRPEFPEVSKLGVFAGRAHSEDAERRCGWLYSTDEWVSRVELEYSLAPAPGEDI
jgi:hypothetical protein